MFRFSFADDFLLSAAERARRLHSRWLTRAFRHGGARGVPRIPTRPVSEGGFQPVTSTPDGRAWADRWWRDTLELEDLA